jgi:RNA polymerase sigma-70 factor, ECF subfamily
MDKSESALIGKAKKDPREFEVIYRRYASKVFNYFWYRTGHDKALAEDLMQETFLRAFKHLPKYRSQEAKYLTYLLSIAHNLLIDHYRKPQSIPVEDLSTDSVPHEITEELERKSEAEALWRAIQTLPQKNRDALLMFYHNEMPIKEIAKVMNTTENAVKLNLSRTRKKLYNHPYLQDIQLFAQKERKYTAPRFLKKKQ